VYVCLCVRTCIYICIHTNNFSISTPVIMGLSMNTMAYLRILNCLGKALIFLEILYRSSWNLVCVSRLGAFLINRFISDFNNTAFQILEVVSSRLLECWYQLSWGCILFIFSRYILYIYTHSLQCFFLWSPLFRHNFFSQFPIVNEMFPSHNILNLYSHAIC
jgi:hypothetical protein